MKDLKINKKDFPDKRFVDLFIVQHEILCMYLKRTSCIQYSIATIAINLTLKKQETELLNLFFYLIKLNREPDSNFLDSMKGFTFGVDKTRAIESFANKIPESLESEDPSKMTSLEKYLIPYFITIQT